MKRTIVKWTVQEILLKLSKGQLNYKPSIQRQFVYNVEQQQQVIISIKKGFVASSLVVEQEAPNSFVLLDGKQRINSIIGFINKAFTIDSFYFEDSYRKDRPNAQDRYAAPKITEDAILDADTSDSATLLRFEFPVVLYSDLKDDERLVLFNVINTTGERLNIWELINGRYPSGLLLDMRQYFNEMLHTNSTSIDPNFIRVKKFEKYFGTHEVNRGELYSKIVEKMFVMDDGTLDNQPYEINADGVRINEKNYERLCKFISKHNSEKFTDFAKPLIEHLDVFYEMFGDIQNLGVLKEACFGIKDDPFFQEHKVELDTDDKKAILAYLISQYNNSDIKNGNDHIKYFQSNILPLALAIPNDFRTKLDLKRFYTKEDKERIFFASDTYDASTSQVKCQGVMNDGVTQCGCGKWLSKDEATVDHIQPWILGGKTDDSNAQILCRECNSKKGAKVISELLLKGVKKQ